MAPFELHILFSVFSFLFPDHWMGYQNPEPFVWTLFRPAAASSSRTKVHQAGSDFVLQQVAHV